MKKLMTKKIKKLISDMEEIDISKSPFTSYNHALHLSGIRVFRKNNISYLVTHNKIMPRPFGTQETMFARIQTGLGINLFTYYKKDE
jgi:hypothetical protein